MRRRAKFLSYGAALLLLTFFAVALAVAEQTPPDSITIKAGLWPTPTKSPVTFHHKKHAEDRKIPCQQCHHVYKDGQNVWKQGDPVQKCEACHTEPTIQGEKQLPPDQQKKNLKLAFHGLCLGCHSKLKKENPNSAAPVACTGCHPGSK